MIVRVEMDRYGCLRVIPDSVRWLKRFQNLLLTGGSPDCFGGLFLQGDAALAWLEDCSPSQRKDIDAGWQVKMRMDPWVFGQQLGYDCGDRLDTRPREFSVHGFGE